LTPARVRKGPQSGVTAKPTVPHWHPLICNHFVQKKRRLIEKPFFVVPPGCVAVSNRHPQSLSGRMSLELVFHCSLTRYGHKRRITIGWGVLDISGYEMRSNLAGDLFHVSRLQAM